MWNTRDLDAWSTSLTPDVKLYSPTLQTPFQGRQAAVELFGILFEQLRQFEITHEFGAGGSQAFFWRAEVGGKTIEGVDLVQSDAQGNVCEIRVLIRPLVDIATFGRAVGPPLAAKRGRTRVAVVKLLNRPLGIILGMVDAAATRLTQGR